MVKAENDTVTDTLIVEQDPVGLDLWPQTHPVPPRKKGAIRPAHKPAAADGTLGHCDAKIRWDRKAQPAVCDR
ncbi:hypothetical protein RA210_U250049 [Rubrivivax sp. A210]|nr:hypothetical protein RA210_U250049 [Rubrivivax sp. A210]